MAVQFDFRLHHYYFLERSATRLRYVPIWYNIPVDLCRHLKAPALSIVA